MDIVKYSKVVEDDIYLYTDEVRMGIDKVDRILSLKNQAIEKNQFIAMYTPKISFRTGKVMGAELGFRWQDTETGTFYDSSDYLSLFENGTFIRQIDLIVLKSACQVLKAYTQGQPDFTLSIAMNPFDFESKEFISNVKGIISSEGINPGLIEVSLSDNKKYLDPRAFKYILKNIKKLGFKIGVANFGNDKTSLTALAKMKFNSIHLDPYFTANNLDNERDTVLLRCTIDILSKLDTNIVIRGISSEPCLKELSKICRDVLVEGDFFTKVLTQQEFISFLNKTYEFKYPEPQKYVLVGHNDTEPKESKETTTTTTINVTAEKSDHSKEIDELRRQMEAMRHSFEDKLDAEREKNHQLEIENLKRQIAEANSRNNQPIYQQYPQGYQVPYDYHLSQELYELRKQILYLQENKDDRSKEKIYELEREIQKLRDSMDSEQAERNGLDELKTEILKLQQQQEAEEKEDTVDPQYEELLQQINELKSQQQQQVDVNSLFEKLKISQDEQMNSYLDELKTEITKLQQQQEVEEKEDTVDPQYEELLQQINELKSQQQQQVDVNSLFEKLKISQDEQMNNYLAESKRQQQELLDTLEKERKEREELERMIAELNQEEAEEEVDEETIEHDQDLANQNVNLDIESLGNDDSDDDDSDDDEEEPEIHLEKPTLSQSEVESIINSYKEKYKEDWNKKAKEELKDGYYEIVNGLLYYRGKHKKNLPERIKTATPEVKQLYNIVKNEFMQYDNIKYKVTNNFDSLYVNKKLVAKLSITKRRVRVYMALNPNDYSPTQFPHRDVSLKKVHVKTPYLMFIKSQLSVKRLRVLIADLMTENETRINQDYKPVDYANMFKFYNRNHKNNFLKN